ncbi:MAG: hypothetical protein A7316_09830 [Candidatus Altiarchaeales archaeon WOR_SM1_86-2]|nr:MAG: hypothetical protein A7316_09830 [Candidatus Altiarchaeales archaeon WOR_SM1_86-2]
MNIICFDLEGPLSPQDNAYEVMGLVENGHKIFEVISRYDDLLTLEGRKNYEPGDTLALIVPFLIYHGITEDDIKEVSKKAKIVEGTKEAVSELKKMNWKVHIISTSYQQHAYNIGGQISVPGENISCTRFPLNRYREEFKGDREAFLLIEGVESEIINYLYPAEPQKDEKIRDRLDRFFFRDLPQTKIGNVITKMSVVGGQRKVDAMNNILEKHHGSLKNTVVVGDSITDFKMLKTVRDGGGLAVVFNGNEYAVPYANIGLATTNMQDLLPLINTYMEGGKERAIELVRGKETKEKPPHMHYLENADKEKINMVVETHKKFRALVRGDAAKLG